eukprot:3166379-Pyramimonas_sp.AAC.1
MRIYPHAPHPMGPSGEYTRENIPARPASDGSVRRIYPHAPHPMGPLLGTFTLLTITQRAVVQQAGRKSPLDPLLTPL